MTEEGRLETIKELFRLHQNGRFDIERILGIGGMGMVVRAQDTRLRVARAIKIFNPEWNSNENMLQRFKNEAAIMAGIDHPNIVKVFDVDEIQGHHFMILEWIDGGSLGNFIEHDLTKPARPMHPRVVLLMIYYVCDALSVAHKRGVVHRDIKPDNILITLEGIPKVADFGIAHLEDTNRKRLTATKDGMGSPGYMAPEQVSELASADARTDVYSVAVTFWSLLKGRRPQGLFFFHDIEDDPSLMENIPDCLNTILRKAVQRKPENRYHSIADFVLALRSVEYELPVFDDSSRLSIAADQDPNVTEPTMAAATQAAVTKFAERLAGHTGSAPVATLIPSHVSPMVAQRATLEYRPDPMSLAQELPKPVFEPELTLQNVEPVHSPPAKPQWLKRVLIVGAAVMVGFVAVYLWNPRKPEMTSVSFPTSVTSVTFDTSVASTPDVSVSPDVQTVPEVVSVPEDVSQIDVANSPSTFEGEGRGGGFEKVEKKKERKETRLARPVEVNAGETLLLKPKIEQPNPPPIIDPPQPKPEMVKVSVGFEGDKVRAWLVGQGGKFKLPGSVPPGVYKVVAIFPDQDSETTVLKNVEIKEGTAVRIHCVPETEKCSKL